MFEKTLADQLKRIFDFDKVTYDTPGESQEQEGLFVAVETARTRVIDARQIAHVTGKLHVFAQAEKLPYGYFSKRLAAADPADTKGLYFYNFDENKGTHNNIAERTLSFVYLFDSQYDPAVGSITQINLSISES